MRSKGTVTIRQVAAAAGVSCPTVSQILNGKGWYAVDTKRRVMAAAQRLDYRPNAYAKAMSSRSGRFGALALLLARERSHSIIPEGMLDGIDLTLSEAGLHLHLGTLPDEELVDEASLPLILTHLMADGLLVNYNSVVPQRMLELIASHRVPAVYLNARHEANAVHPDDRGGAEAATRHLLGLGHRRIAFFDPIAGYELPGGHYSFGDRRAGYRAAMAEAGCEPMEMGRARGGLLHPERLAYALEILARPDRPSAVLGYNDEASNVLLLAAARLGIPVPEGLSLIAFMPSIRSSLGLEVGTALLPFQRIGSEAVTMLLARVEDRADRPTLAVPLEIHPGETVSPPA